MKIIKPVIILVIISLSMVGLYGKTFENQRIITAGSVKATIIDVPYNQNVTIEFPEIIRKVWTSETISNMVPTKDNQFLQVSTKVEGDLTVILVDGSYYPIRLVPNAANKDFAFNMKELLSAQDKGGQNTVYDDIRRGGYNCTGCVR